MKRPFSTPDDELIAWKKHCLVAREPVPSVRMTNNLPFTCRNPRYLVNENLEDFDERPLPGYRPQNVGPYGPNSRPIVPASYPGNKGTPPVLVGPGGPTGVIKRYPASFHHPTR